MEKNLDKNLENKFPCFPLLNLLLRVPYTHRIDRRNNQFQIMQKIFTGLENAFVGPGWSWKPHKSKEHIFLHRNYTKKYLNSDK